MFKKYISVFLIVASVLLVMTSCAKKENTETTTNPEIEDTQIILDEDTTEESIENVTGDIKPSVDKDNSVNTTKPSASQSTTKPTQENPTTTKPNNTNPTTTKPSTTKPTTTNKNEAGICSICGGIITSEDGNLSIGKYCDGRCDEWNNL